MTRSFDNFASEFLQLAAFGVLTSFLIFKASAENKGSDERLEANVDAMMNRLGDLQKDRQAARALVQRPHEWLG